MKKRTLTPYLLSICLGLLISTGGLYESRIAFCQEEEKELLPTRPRSDMQQHSLGKEKAVNPQGHMQSDPVKNKKETIADDGEHGDKIQRSMRPIVPTQEKVADDGQHDDGIQPSMQPAVPIQQLKPKAPVHQVRPEMPNN